MVLFALGVLAALAAGVLYSVGVTLQSVEARQAPDEESLRASLIKRLATRPRWLGGTGCVLGGWAMQATALTLVPITIVQPALAVSVLALLVIGVRFFGETARGREVVAAVAIVAGVGGLVVGSPGQSSTHATPLPLALGMGALGAVALAPYALRGHRRFDALVAVSAGLAYAWTGFSTKFMADGVSTGAWVVAALWLGATAAAARRGPAERDDGIAEPLGGSRLPGGARGADRGRGAAGAVTCRRELEPQPAPHRGTRSLARRSRSRDTRAGRRARRRGRDGHGGG